MLKTFATKLEERQIKALRLLSEETKISQADLVREAIDRYLKELDSACQRPQAAFGGKELYPTLFANAAALGHSLLLNHPFVDGNKRTVWEAMKRFSNPVWGSA